MIAKWCNVYRLDAESKFLAKYRALMKGEENTIKTFARR